MESLGSLSYSSSRSRSRSEPLGIEFVKSKTRSKTPIGIAFVDKEQYEKVENKRQTMKKRPTHKRKNKSLRRPPIFPPAEAKSESKA